MATLTIYFGLALIAISGTSYGLSEVKSLTAFIPAGIGLLFIVLGFVAKRGTKPRKIAMHIAVLLALVLIVPTPRSGIMKLVDAVSGNAASPLAAYSQGIVALLALIYFVLCIRSFINARRAGEMS